MDLLECFFSSSLWEAHNYFFLKRKEVGRDKHGTLLGPTDDLNHPFEKNNPGIWNSFPFYLVIPYMDPNNPKTHPLSQERLVQQEKALSEDELRKLLKRRP